MTSSLPPLEAPDYSDDLVQLAQLDRPFNDAETQAVLSQVNLFVVADDEPNIRRIIPAILRSNRLRIRELSGDIQQCFKEFTESQNGTVPLVLCQNGQEADQATRLSVENRIDNSVMIFDQQMGRPEGLDIFREYADQLPSRTARVLFSGTMPDDYLECLENGVLDAAIAKPAKSPRSFQNAIARAFLRRSLKHTD